MSCAHACPYRKQGRCESQHRRYKNGECSIDTYAHARASVGRKVQMNGGSDTDERVTRESLISAEPVLLSTPAVTTG
eukprot:5431973-Pleurochrysis_carterae.AAC.5